MRVILLATLLSGLAPRASADVGFAVKGGLQFLVGYRL